MSWDLNRYETEFKKSPTRVIRKVVIWLFILGTVLSIASYAFGWFSEAATVAKDEFGAKASLKKYEWFKDCSAAIEQKGHTINVYSTNVSNMQDSYSGIPRKDWDRLDKQQYNVWSMEITGLKASYNKVVEEYNAQSSKFNWSLYNQTELPKKYDLYLDE